MTEIKNWNRYKTVEVFMYMQSEMFCKYERNVVHRPSESGNR